MLKAHNVSVLRPNRRPRQPKRYTRPVPGDRVQIDTCKIGRDLIQFTAIDDCTRMRVLGLYSSDCILRIVFFTDCRGRGPLSATDGEDAEYSVGFWDNPEASLQWQMTVPNAGKYRVNLTYGNGNDVNDFSFSAGDQKLTGKTAKTGGWETWKTMNLGEVTLPAGESTFTLSPEATLSGGLMDFKLLRLVPVK